MMTDGITPTHGICRPARRLNVAPDPRRAQMRTIVRVADAGSAETRTLYSHMRMSASEYLCRASRSLIESRTGLCHSGGDELEDLARPDPGRL
jgi:hypothetical protein